MNYYNVISSKVIIKNHKSNVVGAAKPTIPIGHISPIGLIGHIDLIGFTV